MVSPQSRLDQGKLHLLQRRRHIPSEKGHEKKRWSWLSPSFPQRTHRVSRERPMEAKISRVLNFPLMANQRITACLGILLLNQTTLCQSTLGPRVRTLSHALFIENIPLGVSVQRTLLPSRFKFPRATSLNFNSFPQAQDHPPA